MTQLILQNYGSLFHYITIGIALYLQDNILSKYILIGHSQEKWEVEILLGVRLIIMNFGSLHQSWY